MAALVATLEGGSTNGLPRSAIAWPGAGTQDERATPREWVATQGVRGIRVSVSSAAMIDRALQRAAGKEWTDLGSSARRGGRLPASVRLIVGRRAASRRLSAFP